MDTLLTSLQQLDASVFLFFNGLHADWLDHPVKTLTNRWIWVPLYVVVAALVVRLRGLREGLLIVLCACAAVGLADYICASVIRPFCGRLRPSNLDNPLSAFTYVVDNYRAGRHGFPSCHAANTTALATFLSLCLRRRAIAVFMFMWATILCYTRVYLGVHYPGDLLVGALIGASLAYVVYMTLYRWLYSLPSIPRLYTRMFRPSV